MTSSDLYKAERVLQIVEVMRLRSENDGMTITEACSLAGISPDVYRYWIEKDPDAIDAIVSLSQEVQRRSMAAIVISVEQVLMKLIEDALSSRTSAAERLMIFQELHRRADKFIADAHERTSRDKSAASLLTGPKLELGTSKFSSAEIDESGQNLSITIKSEPVIDGRLFDRTSGDLDDSPQE
jgi:hypothetical protein